MRRTYTVALFPDPDSGYVVEVPALPGCITHGQTMTQALQMAEDAIVGYLSVLQEDGDAIPREGRDVTVGLGRRREAMLRKVTITVPEATPVA